MRSDRWAQPNGTGVPVRKGTRHRLVGKGRVKTQGKADVRRSRGDASGEAGPVVGTLPSNLNLQDCEAISAAEALPGGDVSFSSPETQETGCGYFGTSAACLKRGEASSWVSAGMGLLGSE